MRARRRKSTWVPFLVLLAFGGVLAFGVLALRRPQPQQQPPPAVKLNLSVDVSLLALSITITNRHAVDLSNLRLSVQTGPEKPRFETVVDSLRAGDSHSILLHEFLDAERNRFQPDEQAPKILTIRAETPHGEGHQEVIFR